MNQIEDMLEALVKQCRTDLRSYHQLDVRRQVFQLSLVSRLAPRGTIADIGGGIGLFSAGCAALQMQSTLIDDFSDQMNDNYGDDALLLHKRYGVNIIRRDVILEGLGLELNSMDVITSFDSMEHWHNSPKTLFREVTDALRPGGWFLLGVPNCVNLRKRITTPFGKNKWSQMADWYETPVFRGHVREPDIDDLRYIARDMCLKHVTVTGKNWLGYRASRRWVRSLTPVGDRLLQRRPSLCSDLYMLGQK